MKLSIITINYNNVNGLKNTIKSVIKQTFKDFEWIVIDGNSSDGSKELIEKYATHFSYWVSEPDNGIYHAMNKGTLQAKGEYCLYLNSGDYLIDETVLENVFAQPLWGDINYGDVWCIQNDKIIEKRTYPDDMNLSFLFRNPLGHQATFIKTEITKKHPYREEYRISADRAFFLELFCNNYSFHHLSLPIVYFDTDGIGSNPKTLESRREQLYNIKRIFFADQVVKDFERLQGIEDEFLFVQRIPPLRWTYLFFKKLQQLKNKIS